MTDITSLFSSPSVSGALAVERAIAELRAGRPVALGEGADAASGLSGRKSRRRIRRPDRESLAQGPRQSDPVGAAAAPAWRRARPRPAPSPRRASTWSASAPCWPTRRRGSTRRCIARRGGGGGARPAAPRQSAARRDRRAFAGAPAAIAGGLRRATSRAFRAKKVHVAASGRPRAGAARRRAAIRKSWCFAAARACAIRRR